MTSEDSTTTVRITGTDERPAIEVTVAAPVAVVWPHLRDPELIRRWHGWDSDELEAEIQFIYVEHSDADDDAHVIQSRGGPGDRFDVEPAGPDTTVVRITRGARGNDPEWDAMYDDITQGWITFLAQLKFAVERHPGVDRRTVFRGRFGEPGRRIHDLPDISGTTWFRTPDQFGLVVDEYGPGLVIVADKPGEDPQTADVSMIIVSTFGLSDTRFAEVESAWSRWWSEQAS